MLNSNFNMMESEAERSESNGENDSNPTCDISETLSRVTTNDSNEVQVKQSKPLTGSQRRALKRAQNS